MSKKVMNELEYRKFNSMAHIRRGDRYEGKISVRNVTFQYSRGCGLRLIKRLHFLNNYAEK